MTLSALKRQARQSLKGKWGAAVLLMIVYFLMNTIVPIVVEVIISGGWSAWSAQENPPAAAEIFNLLYSLALIPLGVAIYWVFLDAYRGEAIDIADIFTVYGEGKMWLKLIGTSILYGIFVVLWSLLLVIPGIIKALSYSQAFFLFRDHPEYGALEAIRESKKRMKGYKWKLFLLYLSFIGWGILSILTLGIGLLWLIPYVYTSLAAFYEEFIRTQEEEIVE
ncbi:DUF975 family protein [Anoxybacteroides tepidamans]|uniref:DUF975 family protein n=1 Tax=Anoxybacteroides tepidamans TaxID=265948 RepID=UPI000481BE9D|nr:DUF975 family protein [Anoxybacillus tepidamans]